MAQTLAGVTIHVDNEGLVLSGESNYTFQDVLDATVEVIDYFGAKSERIQLNFYLDEDLNSNTGLTTLRAALKANANVNLTLHEGSWGNWRMLSLSAAQVMALNHTNRVWKCSSEMVAA